MPDVAPYAYASIEMVPARTQAPAASGVQELLVEAKLMWGGDVLDVRHLKPRARLTLRDVGKDVGGDPELVIAREQDGVLVLCLPNGHAVPEGCRMTLRTGRTQVRLTLVADDAEGLPPSRLDRRVALGVAVAAALHLVVLFLVAHGREPAGTQEEAARETLLRMVAAADERALGELAAANERAAEGAGPAALPKGDAKLPPAAVAAAHERGRAGNPSRASQGQGRLTRGDDPGATRPGHEEVGTFGILALLAGTGAGAGAGTSAFAAETGPAALGNIFGQTIHDAQGMGGLGLSGAGDGGGGLGAGVSLSAIGTVGKASGTGTGQGFGCACGVPQREHRTWVPVMTSGTLKVGGRLPPEAIQRVVRQSFGRLRACYERGLQRSPDLEGRIAVKFVIDREGTVTMASTAESSLGDPSVETCVARAYESMSFPKPEGGIVTVVYPVVFTRTSP